MDQLPYNESCKNVKIIAKWFLHQQDPNIVLKMDPEILRLYRLLTLYFTNNPEFETYSLKVADGKIPYSLRKGILLIGSTGRSKTFCFEKVFKTFTNKYIPSKKYRVVNAHAIQMAFEKKGLDALNTFRKDNKNDLDNIYIDEIGIEEFTVQHFGNKQSPVSTFLHERHRLFTTSNGSFITHGSSNLKLNSDKDEINFKKAYGERNYSRLFEMFNIIFVGGDNDLRINIIPD
jgi:hypothetical protein